MIRLFRRRIDRLRHGSSTQTHRSWSMADRRLRQRSETGEASTWALGVARAPAEGEVPIPNAWRGAKPRAPLKKARAKRTGREKEVLRRRHTRTNQDETSRNLHWSQQLLQAASCNRKAINSDKLSIFTAREATSRVARSDPEGMGI